MTVKKEKNGNVLNVSIEGAVDIQTAPQLKQELDGELDDFIEIENSPENANEENL